MLLGRRSAHHLVLCQRMFRLCTVGLKLVGSGPSGNKVFPALNRFGLVACGGGTTNGTPETNIVDAYEHPDSANGVPRAAGIHGWALDESGGYIRSFGLRTCGWNGTTPSRPSGTGSSHAVADTPSGVRIPGGRLGDAVIDPSGIDNPLGVDPDLVWLEPGAKVYYGMTAWI